MPINIKTSKVPRPTQKSTPQQVHNFNYYINAYILKYIHEFKLYAFTFLSFSLNFILS